ncbi:asparagine synthase (glutamine-hydrolyzing) [Candidatus Woesearchaeota archaeon]|nr:MAG: asparagine synthase (glutamine-hydrolyzing) [Candidatus Woesearchaeota archaeon]
MCGIAGLIGEVGNREDIVKEMAESLSHRGPDDEGYYNDDSVSLGHKRLSIIDLKTGRQPMLTPDGNKVIVYNGEVYNFKEIRKKLEKEGAKFRTKSDTEVILLSIDRWGYEAIKLFNGMFAFAIWDRKKKELLLARDRLGIKPVYYYQDKGLLAFASEIKAILKYPGVKRELNNEALAEYLTFQNILTDRTFFKGIKKLMPGHYMIWKNGRAETVQYWDAEYSRTETDFGKAVKKYLRILDDAVKRHMISDVPLGSYLSGGFDSGSVAFTSAKNSRSRISTFTGAFDEGPKYTELPAARSVAEKIKAKRHEVIITKDDFIPTLPILMYHLDEPTTGSGAFPQWHVSKLVSEHVKVVLTGHGGDELFAGYQAYKGVHYRTMLKENPLNLLKILPGMKPSEIARIGYFLIYPMFQKEVRHGLFIMFPKKELKKLLTDKFYSSVRNHDPDETIRRVLGKRNFSDIDKTQYLYLKTYLHTLFVLEDKIGMAHSIEARTPLCDNEIVEFAGRIPIEVKLHNNTLKAIPKAAMKGKLPEILYKQPKKGFPTPIVLWFRGPLRKHIYDVLTGRRIRERGIFNVDYIKKILDSFMRRRTDTLYDYAHANRIYSLYTIELWFRIFIDPEEVKKPDSSFFKGIHT